MRATASHLWRHVSKYRAHGFTLAALTVLGLLAVLGPTLWGETARAIDTDSARQGMSSDHWLGTDDLGRDVLARTLVATRSSLVMALAAALIASISGLVLGCLAAIARGRTHRALNALIHWALAFPPIIVALFVCAVMGPGGTGAVVAIGIALAPSFARVAQTMATEVAGSDYLAAARKVGVRRWRLVTRYLMPNIAEPLIIQGSVTVGLSLVSIAALSFLGLGMQPPGYDWGRMLTEGLDKIFTTPVVALAPAVAIVVCGLIFSQLGDILARSLQGAAPRQRRRRPRDQRGSSVRSRHVEDQADVAPTSPDDTLTVEGLTVSIESGGRRDVVVDRVTFSVARGERLGVVGESGSGKTMTALAIGQLLPSGVTATADRLELNGRDLLTERGPALRRLLGLKMAMVFQDPSTSFNPMLRIGRQLSEGVELHHGTGRHEGLRRAVQKLAEVHVPAPERRVQQYPHEFSGGMRQRAMIAMGLMGEPEVIIADEPTTALDVTVQAQILDLLREVNDRASTTVVLITHDVGVVADFCTRVIVMYAGHVVEDADVTTLLGAPRHPYTQALVAAVPDLTTDLDRPLQNIPGRPPQPGETGRGCPFASRCPHAVVICEERPALEVIGPGHRVACWRAEELHDPGSLTRQEHTT